MFAREPHFPFVDWAGTARELSRTAWYRPLLDWTVGAVIAVVSLGRSVEIQVALVSALDAPDRAEESRDLGSVIEPMVSATSRL